MPPKTTVERDNKKKTKCTSKAAQVNNYTKPYTTSTVMFPMIAR
jgi:hypothetical protein